MARAAKTENLNDEPNRSISHAFGRSGCPTAGCGIGRAGALDGLLLGYDTAGWVMTAALAFENLTLGYDRHPAVHHLQAKIATGSLTAVIGPNGAGKSTLLKGVMGTLAPLEGRVSFGDLARNAIGYLPQQAEIDRSFPISVIELVAMGLWHDIGPFGWLRKSSRQRVEAAIAAVGMTGFEDRPIGSLSGGQMQRALFARLIVQDPQLVLLDEPFAAIDTRTMADLINVIHRWHGEGRTVLAVLHDYEMVRGHFPEALMLARELVAHGPTDAVLTKENRFRARQMCEACDSTPHICGKSAA